MNYFRLSIANSLVTQYRPHHPQFTSSTSTSSESHSMLVNCQFFLSHSHTFYLYLFIYAVNSTQLQIINKTCFNVLIDPTRLDDFSREEHKQNYDDDDDEKQKERNLNRSPIKQQKIRKRVKSFLLLLAYDLTFVSLESISSGFRQYFHKELRTKRFLEFFNLKVIQSTFARQVSLLFLFVLY